MTDPQVALLMLGLFIFVVFLGFPIAFTLMAMGIGFGYYAYFDPRRMWRAYNRLGEDASWWDSTTLWIEGALNNRIFDLFINQTYTVMSNEVLTAVPLFLFMGYIVERANIVSMLFSSLNIAAKRMPGSMGVAALVSCALFATATGIVGAVVTLMGLLAFPAMLRAGYDAKLSAGVVCAGGCLGILIPPSVMLILYGATAGVSVVKLYAGAFFPGLMLATLYGVYVMARALLNPSLAPKLPESERNVPLLQVLYGLATSFLPLAALIVAVLGSILFGLATPSEAAAVGALGSLILAAVYRALTFEKLKESVFLTARTSAMVCWLFVGSFLFSAVFAYLGGHNVIKDFVIDLDLTPIMFLLLTQVIIFILGWPLEWTEIIVIFVPIFLPLMDHFGIDPLFFGLLIALNIQTSFLSPPVAMAPFYLKGVAPKGVTINQIFAGVLPFMFLVLIAMALLYVFPEIGLWLPNYVYR